MRHGAGVAAFDRCLFGLADSLLLLLLVRHQNRRRAEGPQLGPRHRQNRLHVAHAAFTLRHLPGETREKTHLQKAGQTRAGLLRLAHKAQPRLHLAWPQPRLVHRRLAPPYRRRPPRHRRHHRHVGRHLHFVHHKVGNSLQLVCRGGGRVRHDENATDAPGAGQVLQHAGRRAGVAPRGEGLRRAGGGEDGLAEGERGDCRGALACAGDECDEAVVGRDGVDEELGVDLA
mmetsp:Transcript_24700/g.60098  ORF Transcript_24700/g.60098 Transcript_24700/m.60098 type:complete len:230 (+) Transcript_24700:654-1343(+)